MYKRDYINDTNVSYNDSDRVGVFIKEWNCTGRRNERRRGQNEKKICGRQQDGAVQAVKI